ncbi:Peptidase C25, gingipain [Thermoplasmatales archaeon SCGC AB-540-F20]|nr:Peptidase C25, gingipain [Thermoplasmatales archaeon SCGC AB-540-F20]
MKRILPLLVVGILVLSGFGAVAFPCENTKFESKSINFSYPTITDENEYITINMVETNSFLMKQNKPLLPSYIQTFIFEFGTKIKSVTCTPNDIHKQTISKYIMPTPKAVTGGNTQSNEKFHVSTVNYWLDPYPNTWFTYDVGSGINNNERCVIVKVQIFPIQYHPADRIVEWASNVDIIVEYKEPAEPFIFNDDYTFIILGPSEFSDELASLVTYKISRGITTIFVSLTDIYNGVHFPATGRDNQEKIKYFIKSAIENWNTDFVLLVGGIDKFPARETHVQKDDDDEIFLSDLYYADIYNDTGGFCSWDSNENNVFGEYDWGVSHNFDDVDLYPDVYLGRLACVSGSEVTISVNKIKTYENNEAYAQHWFNNIVVVGGDHYPGDDHAVDEGEFVNQKIMDIMAGFVPDRIWDSNGKLSGVIPTGVQEINGAINAGCGFVDFSGHGNTNVWATHPHEDEAKWIPTPLGYYINTHVKGLSNGDKLPIVIIGACSTCKYNLDPDCFGWSFILNNNGGGIAACGASGLDWFYSGEYVAEKGFEKICIDAFEAYYNGAMTFGEMWSGAINGYIYASMDALDYKTVEEFQPFGDPTLAIRGDSQSPNKPTKPSGPANGKTETTYTYSTSAIDPDGDQVYYLFDWGDNTTSGWIGPYNSGDVGSADHKWTSEDNYEIKAIAKDENGVISVWSDPLPVTMPKNKPFNFNFPLLSWLFERFPHAFPILRQLLEL